jgi:hypothetical protein
MMLRGMIGLLVWLLLALPALAQAPPELPTCTFEDQSALDAAALLARSFDSRGQHGATPRLLTLSADPQARLSANSVHLLLAPGERDTIEWAKMRLLAAARTVEHVTREDGTRGSVHVPVFARLHGHAAGVARIELDLPQRPGLRFAELWHGVVAVCNAADNRIIAYGAVDVRVHSRLWSSLLSGGLLIAVYAMLAAVALRINARRLDAAAAIRATAEGGRGESGPGWRWMQALNPLFITQDAAGIGSLSRLQLLVFTLAVVFIYAYVLARTGELAALSPDVLALLGITVLGSGLSRMVGEAGSVSHANRSWLKARGLLRRRDDRLPRLSDLVCADGELEIARVQAIIFSSITVVALLIKGPRDLGGFQISAETLYLLGLSQAAFVAGKAIPAEGVRRLNAEITAMRNAERELLDAQQQSPGSPGAEGLARSKAAWNGALAAAEDTLADVYGETLDEARLRALRLT